MNKPWPDAGKECKEAFDMDYSFSFFTKWLKPTFYRIFCAGWDAAKTSEPFISKMSKLMDCHLTWDFLND